MEFKHTFHVFVDNFFTTYKLLVYRLIVLAVTVGLSCAVIIPTLNNILGTAEFEKLSETLSALWADIISLNTEEMHDGLQAVLDALRSFRHLLSDKSWLVAVACICLCAVYFVNRFLVGVGDYVTGTLVNDRMVMHASSSFTFSFFRNIKKALLYAIIYAPIALVYDLLCLVIIWAIVRLGLNGFSMALIKIFIIAVLLIVFTTVKFAFTADWIPALVHSKKNNRAAIAYALSRRGKHTGRVFSNTLIIKLITIALNVSAFIFTFGAGLLITLPASCLIQITFCFVNYFDANKLKYFVDEYTVIGPKKETPVSREEFFKGDD